MLSVHNLMQEAKVAPRERARLGKKEERRLVAIAIDDLPEISRVVLGLCYYESVRPAQIAEALGMLEDEVRSVLAEALEQILESRAREAKPGATKGDPQKVDAARRRNGKVRGV